MIDVIKAVDANKLRTKRSKEKTMRGRMLYSPIRINQTFNEEFETRGWSKSRISMKTFIEFWPLLPQSKREEYAAFHTGFREMDYVKNRLGVEVQFGKYAFMVYNVLVKMTIFHKHSLIDAGVEIVPMRRMASEMSTGVSYYEQMKSDLEARGEAELDVPVLVLSVDVD